MLRLSRMHGDPLRQLEVRDDEFAHEVALHLEKLGAGNEQRSDGVRLFHQSRGGSRMPELGPYGSVRGGAAGNSRPRTILRVGHFPNVTHAQVPIVPVRINCLPEITLDRVPWLPLPLRPTTA